MPTLVHMSAIAVPMLIINWVPGRATLANLSTKPDPGQPVVGHGPALGNAGPHAALFEVKRDKAVIDCGLVDGVARAAFEDRIEGLGSKRFNGENQGTFWLLGRSRRGE
jgi:hypothetical protein